MVTVNGQQSRRLEEVEKFYLYNNGEMIWLPDKKSELTEKFSDKKDQIAQFINDQQLKMHSAEDYVLVVKKYNDLLK